MQYSTLTEDGSLGYGILEGPYVKSVGDPSRTFSALSPNEVLDEMCSVDPADVELQGRLGRRGGSALQRRCQEVANWDPTRHLPPIIAVYQTSFSMNPQSPTICSSKVSALNTGQLDGTCFTGTHNRRDKR